MSYNTRSTSSKTSSEHGDTLSPGEAEVLKQHVERREKLVREQSEALAARQLEVEKQVVELEREKEKQNQQVLAKTQGLESVLSSLQRELTELSNLKDLPQQIRALNERVNTLQTQADYPKEIYPPYPTSPPTDIPESSPIRLKDIADSIPNYDGQRMSVFQFCRICERALGLIPRHHEQYLAQLITNKLQGHAYVAIEGTEYKSVFMLLRKLKQIFGPNKTLNQYKGELGNAFMKSNESILDYITRIKELKAAILDYETAQNPRFDDWAYDAMERDILESFINGLPSDLLIRVKLEGYDNLDDAFTRAIQISKTLETENMRRKTSFFNRSNIPSPRQDVPIRNSRTASEAPPVPSPQPQSILQRPTNMPYIKPLIPGQPGPNTPSQNTCGYCKEPGHFIANCQKLAAKNAYLRPNTFSQPHEQIQTQMQPHNISGNAQRAPITSGVRRDTESAGRQQHGVRFQDPVERSTLESQE